VNILFLCSKNQWRSPTAEKIFQKEPGLSVRSRGTSRRARRTVNAQDLQWADLVFVMETKHKQRLRADFPGETKFKRIHVLDIPDDYHFMDPELIELLKSSVAPLIGDAAEEQSSAPPVCELPDAVITGGRSKDALRNDLRNVGALLNQAAEDIFSDTRFQPSEHASEVKIAARTVKSLGFENGASYAQIVARARELGLEECQLELAAYLRLQYLDQPISAERPKSAEPGSPPGAITVTSAPLDGSDEVPKGLYLRNIDGTLWLRGYWSDARHVWSPKDLLVFAVLSTSSSHAQVGD
jgi:predicted protein tyrosine phosphatase